jgi:hypothetical protein
MYLILFKDLAKEGEMNQKINKIISPIMFLIKGLNFIHFIIWVHFAPII